VGFTVRQAQFDDIAFQMVNLHFAVAVLRRNDGMILILHGNGAAFLLLRKDPFYIFSAVHDVTPLLSSLYRVNAVKQKEKRIPADSACFITVLPFPRRTAE
jgi:hypothetical protein